MDRNRPSSDIDEREQDLRESEERFRKFDSAISNAWWACVVWMVILVVCHILFGR